MSRRFRSLELTEVHNDGLVAVDLQKRFRISTESEKPFAPYTHESVELFLGFDSLDHFEVSLNGGMTIGRYVSFLRVPLDFASRESSVPGSQFATERVIYQGVEGGRIRNHLNHFVFQVTCLSDARRRSARGQLDERSRFVTAES